MSSNATGTTSWPGVILILGLSALAALIVLAVIVNLQEHRKATMTSGHETALRQLVERYEQLAEKTMDAQQRIATDLAELRTRTTSIEQILRTVDDVR